MCESRNFRQGGGGLESGQADRKKVLTFFYSPQLIFLQFSSFPEEI